jgi:hypothetical protein
MSQIWRETNQVSSKLQKDRSKLMKSIPKFHIFKANQTDLVQKLAKSKRKEPEREERERDPATQH